MRCPSLGELPDPLVSKTGWPWTIDTSPAMLTLESRVWPRVSIVTPSFQQGTFLEETIRSVLLQGYPNLEYIIIDGGSTDNSVDIIQKYEPWISFWVSEADRGQSHAINKGWERATGEIVAYLNSDDYYLPFAILSAVEALQARPEIAFIYSDGLWVDEHSRKIFVQHSGAMTQKELLTCGTPYGIPQPTAFLRNEAVKEVKGLDESLHMSMDLDLWLKLALRYQFAYLPGSPLAALRSHATQKTQSNVLEGLLCALEVFTRTMVDPLCPTDVSPSGNRAFALLYARLAEFYIYKKNDWKTGIIYLVKALITRPQTAIHRLVSIPAYKLYVAVMPNRLRSWVRNIRARRRGSQAHVQN